jgi:hypothetical protein
LLSTSPGLLPAGKRQTHNMAAGEFSRSAGTSLAESSPFFTVLRAESAHGPDNIARKGHADVHRCSWW